MFASLQEHIGHFIPRYFRDPRSPNTHISPRNSDFYTKYSKRLQWCSWRSAACTTGSREDSSFSYWEMLEVMVASNTNTNPCAELRFKYLISKGI